MTDWKVYYPHIWLEELKKNDENTLSRSTRCLVEDFNHAPLELMWKMLGPEPVYADMGRPFCGHTALFLAGRILNGTLWLLIKFIQFVELLGYFLVLIFVFSGSLFFFLFEIFSFRLVLSFCILSFLPCFPCVCTFICLFVVTFRIIATNEQLILGVKLVILIP
jgi:hypothetical protein